MVASVRAPSISSQMEGPGAVYRATDGIRILELDDEWVVFHPLSWDAHILNPSAASVLDLLIAAPHGLAAIEAFLTEALNDDERENAASHAEQLLGDLLRLGLVKEPGGQHLDSR